MGAFLFIDNLYQKKLNNKSSCENMDINKLHANKYHSWKVQFQYYIFYLICSVIYAILKILFLRDIIIFKYYFIQFLILDSTYIPFDNYLIKYLILQNVLHLVKMLVKTHIMYRLNYHYSNNMLFFCLYILINNKIQIINPNNKFH